jgi:hypothetical protein
MSAGDVVVGREVLNRALAKDLGRKLPLWAPRRLPGKRLEAQSRATFGPPGNGRAGVAPPA